MNVCLSNGTDWIGQELFYFITWWELNNTPQIRAYLWLSLHLIQHVSQILPSLSRACEKRASFYLIPDLWVLWGMKPSVWSANGVDFRCQSCRVRISWVFMGIKRNFTKKNPTWPSFIQVMLCNLDSYELIVFRESFRILTTWTVLYAFDSCKKL